MSAMFEHRIAQQNDVRIAYRIGGEGQAICLLPSVGRGCDDLVELAENLISKGFKTILPEPRGMYGSTGPLMGLSMEDLAQDVLGVLEQEKTPAVIAGHAFGNMVARTCAATGSKMVKAVVLLATAGGKIPAHLETAIDLVSSEKRPEQERLDALALAFFADSSGVKKSWLTGWHKPVIEAQRQARLNSKRESWWPGGTVPILDVIGSEDPFRPADQRNSLRDEFGERIQPVVISNVSHALPEEKPEEVAQVITEFVRSLERNP